ncbi:LPS assembly protein LptD [Pararhodospirillum oryzae]|uniref:LPS-assembly protein LptD n=1 Tax=Pararhodospirillum oryzae TaxID=478448 RepID=A0A512H884_9PROT|nr:LPS assembly protein LptD [Pararhodospirillum oryzae]GEO81669.1 LPS-assembly protein LptD [Pararhodospirillum oryzae]
MSSGTKSGNTGQGPVLAPRAKAGPIPFMGATSWTWTWTYMAAGGLVAAVLGGPAWAQSAGGFVVGDSAVATGIGLPMVGALGSTPGTLSATPDGPGRYVPLTPAGSGAVLPLVGALNEAPSAEPGVLHFTPIDTNHLPDAGGPAASQGTLSPAWSGASAVAPAVSPAAPMVEARGEAPLFGAPPAVGGTASPSPAGLSGETGVAPALPVALMPRPTPVAPVASAPARPVPAPAPPRPDPLASGESLVEADSLTRDDDLGVITARGNVRVVGESRILQADVVTYNTVQGMVTAAGHVVLMERPAPGRRGPEAETSFADYMELTGDLKDGFVRGIQVLGGSGTRLAALYGERSSDAQSQEFARGVYTACASCSGTAVPLPTLTGNSEGTRPPPPAWQVKAARVTHDEAEHNVIFHDAWLEAYGIPVLYTPYLSQPDSTVYRRSGFLTPSTGFSDRLGAEVQVPYYLVLDDHSDARLDFRYTDKQNAIFNGQYNRNFSRGVFSFGGSLDPYDEDGSAQGYYESNGTWHIDPVFRARFESGLTTRPVYLRRLNVDPKDGGDYLTTRVALEGFGERSRGSVESYYFQSITEGLAQSGVPAVPVLADVSLMSDPLWSNSHVEGSVNSMMVRRPGGTDSARLIGRVGYEVPFQDGVGGAYTVSASVRGDAYNAWDQTLTSGDTYDGATGRVVPQGSVIWRHPLVAVGDGYRQVIEPKVGVFAALPNNNPDEIPNEDSRVVTLDTSTLFLPSRVPGLDRVEGGVWTAYGMHYDFRGSKGDALDVDVGQSYRVERDETVFKAGSGLENNLSDIVARIRYAPAPVLSIQYDTQLDAETLDPQRHEVRVTGGTALASGSIGYLFADQTTTLDGDVFTDREEISGWVAARLSRRWQATGGHVYSLDRNTSVRTNLGLTYEDECLRVSSLFSRDHSVEFGIEGGTSFLVTLTLKTLGSYTFSPGLGLGDNPS